jgi:hypothetical protein
VRDPSDSETGTLQAEPAPKPPVVVEPMNPRPEPPRTADGEQTFLMVLLRALSVWHT